MGKIHLFAKKKPVYNKEPKKKSKWFYIIIGLIIIFLFFRIELLTLLFFIAGFII